MEAIVLAGGLGTRLRSVISDLPKPMAPVNDWPFLSYILDQLHEAAATKIVLAVSYKAETIKDYFQDSYKGIPLEYSVEDEPLGTGGGILKALALVRAPHVLVINGDTFFKISLQELYQFHREHNAHLTLAARQVENSDRYGSLMLGSDARIIGFNEKSSSSNSLINGGIYVIDKKFIEGLNLPAKFSFEKDILEKYFQAYRFLGKVEDAPFIDIGIPEDYARAQSQLSLGV